MVTTLLEKTERYEVENSLLCEKIKLLVHQIYGCKSEKFAIDDTFKQFSLFDDFQKPDESEGIRSESAEITTIPEHNRKKRGRPPLSPALPRVKVEHDLSPEEKRCNCGCTMNRIGREVSETLEMIPARFWVVQHIRYKYACKNCEGVESDDRAVSTCAVR